MAQAAAKSEEKESHAKENPPTKTFNWLERPWFRKGIYFANTRYTSNPNWTGDFYYGESDRIRVSPFGVITLRLNEETLVDITLDRTIRIICNRNDVVVVVSSSGASAALMHPNGRVYQNGAKIESVIYGKKGNDKYAKIWYKGVSFTSEECAVVYLVDSAGTCTIKDKFTDLSVDVSLEVFCSASVYKPELRNLNVLVKEAVRMLSKSTFWLGDAADCNWMINDVRVTQSVEGVVRVIKDKHKATISTSPTSGFTRLTTPYLHCSATSGKDRYLYVRHGDRFFQYDGKALVVRNAGHAAGINDNHTLKVFSET